MAYSLLSLKAPGRKLGRAASTSFNPLSAQRVAPVATPDYNQQITGQMAQNQAPSFALGTPNGNSTSGNFGFTNTGNPAFAPMAAPQVGAAAVPGGGSVDYSQDPILMQTQAAVQAQIAQAEAGALASEKQNLIRYGDPSLIAKVLGSSDSATEQAAKDNSFSTVAELGRWNQRSLSGIDTTANRNNLFYSSTRGRDRGLQQEDMVRQQTRTGNQLQDVLSGIAQGLLAQKQQGQAQLLGAGENAYMRAIQMAMAQRYAADPGTGGSAGADTGANEGATAQTSWPTVVTGHGGGGYVPPSPYGWQPPSPYQEWWKRQRSAF